jgi:two-component system, sensor histidine kinase PdtaS
VGSIAMVHETLSHVPDEIVDFDDIASRVAMMAGEVSAAEARVTPRLVGEFGLLPALVATPLALVLTELLQNALQHGLSHPEDAAVGSLEVAAVRGPGRLTVTVSDNGTGLPTDFDLDSTASLGLQIVRTLVLTELNGRLEIEPRAAGGTRVLVELPLGEPELDESTLAEALLEERGARAL